MEPIYCEHCGVEIEEGSECIVFEDRIFCDEDCLDKWVESRITRTRVVEGEIE